jgi:hypothetical protein
MLEYSWIYLYTELESTQLGHAKITGWKLNVKMRASFAEEVRRVSP